MEINILPIIFQYWIAVPGVASNVDNIMDDLHVGLCVANSRISMLLFDFPVFFRKIKSRYDHVTKCHDKADNNMHETYL